MAESFDSFRYTNSKTVLALICCVILTQASCRRVATEHRDVAIVAVRVRPIEQDDSYEYTSSYLGEIEPAEQSNVGFELPGKVVELNVSAGDTVEAGQTLGHLDTSLIDVEREQLLAKKRSAEALLSESKAGARPQEIEVAEASVNALLARQRAADENWNRLKAAYPSKAIAKADYDSARAMADSLNAEVAAAKEKLDQVREGVRSEKLDAQAANIAAIDAVLKANAVRLEKSTLKSPLAGTIVKKMTDSGSVVAAGSPVFRILGSGDFKANVFVPQSDLNQFESGQQTNLVVNGREISATVVAVLPTVDRVSGCGLVKVNFTDDNVRNGQLIELKTTRTVRESGCWIPLTALVSDIEGLWACYAVFDSVTEVAADDAAAGQIRKISVEILFSTASKAYVRSSLSDGNLIVVDGTHRVVPGQRVAVKHVKD